MTPTLLKQVSPSRSRRATVTSDITFDAFGPTLPRVRAWSPAPPRDGSAAAYAAYEALDSTTLLEYQDAQDLEDGWAGEGTLAPSQRTLAVVRHTLYNVHGLLAQPSLTPNDSGTISLEWRTPRGHALVEVGDSTYGLLVRRSGRPSIRLNGSVLNLSREVLAYIAGLLEPARATSIY